MTDNLHYTGVPASSRRRSAPFRLAFARCLICPVTSLFFLPHSAAGLISAPPPTGGVFQVPHAFAAYSNRRHSAWVTLGIFCILTLGLPKLVNAQDNQRFIFHPEISLSGGATFPIGPYAEPGEKPAEKSAALQGYRGSLLIEHRFYRYPDWSASLGVNYQTNMVDQATIRKKYYPLSSFVKAEPWQQYSMLAGIHYTRGIRFQYGLSASAGLALVNGWNIETQRQTFTPDSLITTKYTSRNANIYMCADAGARLIFKLSRKVHIIANGGVFYGGGTWIGEKKETIISSANQTLDEDVIFSKGQIGYLYASLGLRVSFRKWKR